MPTAWIITQAKPEWIEFFPAAGWEVKLFAPAGLAPAGPAPDPDVIIYDAEERPLSDTFRMICQEKLAPLLAIVADWALAWEAVEVGTDDVIVAPVDPNEPLFRARRLVHAANVVGVGELAIELTARRVRFGQRRVKLSREEFRLLACLAERVGQVVSYGELLDEVWGHDQESGTPKLVRNCVVRLRKKFETFPNFFPWFRDGNAQWIAVEQCCAQHSGWFWPNARYGTNDTWDGYIWNQNQAATQYGALAQSPSISAGKRYRLSAWLATSNGNLARLRWYANGVTNECASTTAVWPSYVNKSCEFTPNNTTGFNAHVSGNVATTQWIVSDDWALTALEQVPQSQNNPKRTVFSVTYFAWDYGNSVDAAANNWNNAVPRTPPVFQKTNSEANAQVIVDGVDWGDNLILGATRPHPNYPGNPGKALVEVNIWYMSQWTSNPKVSNIGHELGHALGLGHSRTACQLMWEVGLQYWYCGIVAPTNGTRAPVTGDANSLKALYGWP